MESLSLKNAKWWVVFGLLFGICFLTYNNSLHNPFMLDDFSVLSDVKLNNLKFFLNAFIYPSLHSDHGESFNTSGLYYRPMAYIISMLSYLAFGNKDPYGYHVLNLFLFTGMCFTLYAFVDLFFKDKILAFVTSLLFAVHPINVFFVNYNTSGIHSVRFIFMFLSVILFHKAPDGAHKNILYLASLLCFGMTLLCHETSIVLPFYILFVSIFVEKKDVKSAAFQTWPYFLMLFLFLFFRLHVTRIPDGLSISLGNINPSALIFLISKFSKIIFLYCSKLLFPDYIFFLWSISLAKKFVIIWLGGLFFLLAGWYLLLRANAKSLSFFCATWIMLGFIPVTLASLSEPHLDCIVEPQWLTFSSIGFFVYIAAKGLKLYARMNKWIGRLLLIILLIGWASITRYNNWIWGDVIRYFDYWSGSNNGRLADLGMGSFYNDKKEYPQARQYYHLASQEGPPESRAAAYNSLGIIDMKQGLLGWAKENFLLAIKNDPNNWSSFNNLASIYLKQSDYKTAKQLLLHALGLNNYSVDVRYNLAHIFELESNGKEALKLYNENLNISPYEERSLLALVDIYAQLSDVMNVRKYSRLLINHSQNPAILTDLLAVLGSIGQFPLASEAYEQSIYVDPKYTQAYLTAGQLLANGHKYKEAIHVWQIGKSIDPKDQRFQDNIADYSSFQRTSS